MDLSLFAFIRLRRNTLQRTVAIAALACRRLAAGSFINSFFFVLFVVACFV
jgi:hypothetical protein